MIHQNPERGEFTEEEQAAAKFLDDIYFLGSSSEVVTALRVDNVPLLIKKNKLKSEGTATLKKEEVDKVMTDQKTRAPQRPPKILALIRNTRYDYSEPYEASELDFKWASVYEQARATDAKQKKVLNSYSFNAIRLVQRHQAA